VIYYNITSRLDINIENEWVKWMQETQIPEILNTKYFTEAKLLKINLDENESSCTYAVQLLSSSKNSIDNFIKNKARALKENSFRIFGEKALSFSTKLEVISLHK
jgi:hypothetical protein